MDCPCSLRCGSRPWARVLQPRASREQEAEPCVVVLMGERIARAQSGHSCDVLQPRPAVSLPWTRAPCQLGWGRPHCPWQLSAQDWRHMPSARPLLPPFSTSSGSRKRGARAAVPVRVHVPGRAPARRSAPRTLQAPGPGEARVCRARSRVTAWVLREPQRSSGEEAQALAREAPAVALCAAVCAVCAPGGCRGRVFGAVGPVCVFSIMKVNQKEKRAISRGVSVCIGHWSGNVFQPLALYSDRWCDGLDAI